MYFFRLEEANYNSKKKLFFVNQLAPLFIAFWSITQVGKDIQWLRKTPLPNEDQVSISPTCLRTVFTPADPESAKSCLS